MRSEPHLLSRSVAVSERVAAVDWGKARIGVAVADELGMYAHPRPALDGHHRRAALEALVALAKEEGLTRFLVGLPLDMDGSAGPSVAHAEAFADALAAASGLPVEMVDERWTTVAATRALRASGVKGRKVQKHVDGAAAVMLLQGWLDARAR